MARLNYNHLRYFRAVAHEGNLTRAAEKLHISQSALSVQIQKLEEQLEQKLFERRGKRLHLTEAGSLALDYADEIFAAGDELLGTLKSQNSTERRELYVGALSTLSRNFQIQFLTPLLQKEDVHVHIESGNTERLFDRLQSHRIDVLLTNSVPLRDSRSNWTAHLIDEEPVSLIAHPEHVKADQSLAAALMAAPLILPSGESSIRSGFDAMVERMGVKPRIAAEGDDMAMLRLLARDKAGLAVIPPIVVRDELENGVLVEVAQLPGLAETFYALTLTRRFPNPLLKEIILSL
ncbi:MAG: LysR family transcriptional regulator [Pseudomonadota bacterium]